MKKVKYAIVGCGSVSGNRYFPNVRSIERGQLAAVCDNVIERARPRAEEFGVPCFTDVDELLAQGDFDLLVNLTHEQMHFDLNLRALQAGKHVYTQKPMATTVVEATALIDEAARRNLKLVAEEVRPIFLVNRTIRKLIDDGVIGKVVWARATCTHWGPAIIDNWPTDPTGKYKKGAGPLRDPGVERLHLLTSLLGPARRVSAMSGINQPEVVVRGGPNMGMRIKVEEDDITLLTLDFGNAVFAMIDTAWVNTRATLTPPLEIYGQKGVITHMSGPSREPGQMDFDLRLYRDEPALGVRGWTEVMPIPPLKPDPSVAIAGLVHAIDCILDDKKPIPGGEHARHCIEIIEKAFIAARMGMTQDIETTF